MSNKKQDEFVIYVVTLSSAKRYMSIEFIGGSCGFIIAQKALQSDLFGMIGSMRLGYLGPENKLKPLPTQEVALAVLYRPSRFGHQWLTQTSSYRFCL